MNITEKISRFDLFFLTTEIQGSFNRNVEIDIQYIEQGERKSNNEEDIGKIYIFYASRFNITSITKGNATMIDTSVKDLFKVQYDDTQDCLVVTVAETVTEKHYSIYDVTKINLS